MYRQFFKRRETIFLKGPTFSLERTLLFSFCIHGLAMLATLCFLLPGIPGGPHDSAARMAYVASFPWLWRLGWLPWQLTALSDLLISLALLRLHWRLAALLTVLIVVVGIIPDQMGQFLWITQGVALAQHGPLVLYSQFEATVFLWIGAYGGAFYMLTAVGWTYYFATQQEWQLTRSLLIYSVILWCLFAFLSINPLLPAFLHFSPLWIAGGNALAFVLLLLWFALVTEMVLRHTRPTQAVGRYAPWHYPRAGLGRVFDLLGNSRFVRTLCEYVPQMAFLSDITDVVYVNYLVEAGKLEPFVPEGLELQRLGADERYALFSFLVFRHGHVGPSFLGKARQRLPSPIQTNWRIYVRDPRTGQQGIFLVSNACESTFIALVARLSSEGIPMHVLQTSSLCTDKAGEISLHLDGGSGSAPDARATLQRLDERPVRGLWSSCFASYEEMLAYCVPQERIFSTQPWYGRVTQQDIELHIPLEGCQPLEGNVDSHTASTFVGEATPFCFSVAHVPFQLKKESYTRL